MGEVCHETAGAETVQEGACMLTKLSPVAHAQVVEVQVEAGPSSLVLHWLRFQSSGRHARNF